MAGLPVGTCLYISKCSEKLVFSALELQWVLLLQITESLKVEKTKYSMSSIIKPFQV
jgi:hypothetical protein